MKRSIALMLVVVLITLTAGGCFGPKEDPILAQQTAIAGAVTAQVVAMTTNAFLYPSSTPTPEPTPTQTFTPEPTFTPLPSNTPMPTATVPLLEAKLLSMGTFPVNRNKFEPNENFSITIMFQNVGTIPWYAGSKLVLTGHEGEHITVQQESIIDRQVNPGEKYEFMLWAYGSEDMSYQVFYFQIYNDAGVPIKNGHAAFGYQPI